VQVNMCLVAQSLLNVETSSTEYYGKAAFYFEEVNLRQCGQCTPANAKE
jgi:hypothetical protein